MKKYDFARYLIGFQGFYYFITGLWAIISIDHFNKIVGHAHEGLPFEMHSIAAMSVVLGLYFIYAVRKKDWFKKNKDVLYLVAGIALSVVVVELIYLPKMGWSLFWLDLVEEIAIVAALLLLR